jgi:hypothetical protein
VHCVYVPQCAGCWVRNVESADAGKAHVSAMTNQQSGWKASQTQAALHV